MVPSGESPCLNDRDSATTAESHGRLSPSSCLDAGNLSSTRVLKESASSGGGEAADAIRWCLPRGRLAAMPAGCPLPASEYTAR